MTENTKAVTDEGKSPRVVIKFESAMGACRMNTEKNTNQTAADSQNVRKCPYCSLELSCIDQENKFGFNDTFYCPDCEKEFIVCDKCAAEYSPSNIHVCESRLHICNPDAYITVTKQEAR